MTKGVASVILSPLFAWVAWYLDGSPFQIGVAWVVALTVLLWLTEAVPLAVSSLVPLILLPVLPGGSLQDTARDYLDDIVFLFMGGLLLARAIEVSGLHEFLARRILGLCGVRAHQVLLGFLVATLFLSMWISNTATALMMLPLAHAVADRLPASERGFKTSLYLGVAWTASIGGVATLIGSPPNAVFAAFIKRETGHVVTFLEWAMVGTPFALVGTLMLWQYLCRFVPGFENKPLSQHVLAALHSENAASGSIQVWRIRVAVIFVAVAAAWILRPLLPWGGVTDATIALAGGCAVLLLPRDSVLGPRLLAWKDLKQVPWQILLLVGAGLALSSAITKTGVVSSFAAQLSFLGDWSVWLAVLLIVCVTVLATEFGSNTAVVTLLIPTSLSVAPILEVDLYALALAVALGGSLSFMMPMATPPNAAVFAKGHVSMREMARGGALLNFTFAILITCAVLVVDLMR